MWDIAKEYLEKLAGFLSQINSKKIDETGFEIKIFSQKHYDIILQKLSLSRRLRRVCLLQAL